ncbi:MAG TPA: hypothetical protein VGN48_01615 [Pedococcus sp.]|nr:hypothetical protein [Pedococcus sp.]
MHPLGTTWARDVAELAPQAPPEAVAAVGNDLVRRLEEPHRSYHTAQHVAEMFEALAELADAGEVDASGATIARIAAWFHDAVYDPSAGQGLNELASAELATASLRGLGVGRAQVELVRGLVLATSSHELTSERTTAAFHDADLWILSSPPDRYAQYVAQVRLEYAAVPDDAFRAGRAAVLRPFLERASIFGTAWARDRWEDRARANLLGELDSLRLR